MFWKSLGQKKILNATHAECPRCNIISHVDRWNDMVKGTYGKESPDIRQAAGNVKNSFPFQCPSCYSGFSAFRIKFSTLEHQPTLKSKKHHSLQATPKI